MRVPNQVTLDIELGQIQAAYSELRQASLGDMEERLRIRSSDSATASMNSASRSKTSAPVGGQSGRIPHVEGDAATVADTVASYGILARC